MADEVTRLETRLADVRQALSEARSQDVRAFLHDLLQTYEARLAELTSRDGGPAVSDGSGSTR
jgi:hypothetical protein